MGFRLIPYADNLPSVGTARDSKTLESRANQTLCEIEQWLDKRAMKVAAGKIEATIRSGRKKYDSLTIMLDANNVPMKQEMEYLGVIIDKHLHFEKNVQIVCNKANKTVVTRKMF